MKMKCKKEYMQLYAVTDHHWTGKYTLLEQIEAALCGGITCLQLREKNISFDSFLQEAKEVKKLCYQYNVPLIINDNVEIALKGGADGVHIGQDDMKLSDARKLAGNSLMIGVSAHNQEEAVAAEQNGADYLGCGAAFGSSTKTDANTITLATISEICSSVKIPVVAIGGINANNILKLCGTGVDGAAFISAIFSADNIEQECRKLLKLTEKIITPV